MINNKNIPNFKNIDTSIGLSHMADNKELYLNILNDFKNKYQDLKLDILNEKEFYRVIHTIKSLSATIGALKLNEISKKIENIKKEEYITDFYKELKIVLNELKSINISDIKKTNIKLNKQKKDKFLSNFKECAKKRRIIKCKKLLKDLEIYQFDDDNDFFTKIKDLVNKRKYYEVVEAIDAKQNNTNS